VTLAYAAAVKPPAGNPYDAVGSLLQVEYAWLDLYGNTIVSDLTTPLATDTKPPSIAPMLVGYTDALVGLAQWPSANAVWNVSGTGSATLNLLLSFDVSRYTGKDPDANAKNAIADAHVYAQVAAQIADPHRIAFSANTSLVTAPLPITGTDATSNLTKLLSLLTGINAYLAAITTATPPANTTLSFALTTNILNTDQLFQLDCSFTMARAGGVVEGEFETVPGVRSITARVSPDGAATATGLATFASNLEAAFTTAGTAMLKVAAGPDRYAAGAATSSTLWAVRIGLSAGQPIWYDVDDADKPLIFAPKPISRQLISEPVAIYPYVSGSLIDFKPPVAPPQQTFTNVDLDVWLRLLFTAVDELLSPRYIGAIVVLDALPKKIPQQGTLLETLLANKKALAKMYSQQMDAVFKDQIGADATAAAEALAQAMLEQLGNAYQTQAALQYAVDVDATIVEPPPTNQLPNLYGPVLQTGKPNPVQPGVALTAAKIPLATAKNVGLTFLVTTPSSTGDTRTSHVPLSLEYAPTHIEHQRESTTTPPDPLGDYIASSWLQFVCPPPSDPSKPQSIARSLGNVDVPMVLRAYPSNPALTVQNGAPTFSGTLPPGALVDATQWTYSFTYSLPGYYPQDIVYGTVVFNVEQGVEALAGFVDAFAWIAQFVTIYPRIAGDLDNVVANITPKTTDQTAIATATYAVASVNAMLGQITGVSAVSAHAQPAPRFALRPRSHGMLSATGATWSFSLNEASYGSMPPGGLVPLGPDDLVVTITSTAGPVPVPFIVGYTATNASAQPDPQATVVSYYFAASGLPNLTVDASQSLRRTVEYAGLRILDKQDAHVVVYVSRNEHLVTTRTTNPDFVYRTADATFKDPCMPSIVYTGTLDIAQIDPSSPPPQSLTAYLTTLFDTLTSNASASAMKIQLTAAYQYTVNPWLGASGLSVTIPILMQPPLGVFWGKGTPPPGDVTLDAMIADVAGAIQDWFTATLPSSVGGTLLFSVTMMSSLTATTMPLLRLTDLHLAIADIANPALTVANARRL
jgi:hypothetical protein